HLVRMLHKNPRRCQSLLTAAPTTKATPFLPLKYSFSKIVAVIFSPRWPVNKFHLLVTEPLVHIMRGKSLTVAAIFVVGVLVPRPSDSQSVGWSGQLSSPRDVAQFFQGKVSADDVLARYNVPVLQLMGEKPLVEVAGRQAPRVYRLLVQTRP